MDTLNDLIAFGDKAAHAGKPLTYNWTQVRGCAAFFGRACGGLDKCPIATFEQRFTKSFDALTPADQSAFLTPRAYLAARAQIIQAIIQIGIKDAPWDKLYGLVRKMDGANDILKALSGLKTPAMEAGKTPADICAAWVWSLPAEAEGGSKKMRIRHSVVVFDGLFDAPAIANSGLLPPTRIGVPPSCDKYGREDLPPKLLSYQISFENTSEIRRETALPQLWRAITQAGGLGLSDDPNAQDLLNVWSDIRALQASAIGLAQASWQSVYLQARKALAPHASTPTAELLPPYFAAMVEKEPHRPALKTLWRQMLAAKVDDPEAITAHDLLDLAMWRRLWSNKPRNISPATFSAHETMVRNLLVRHAPIQREPRQLVTDAWARLSKAVQADLAAIRKPAVKGFLRPFEINSEWLDTLDLDPTQRAQVDIGLDAASKPVEIPPAPTPNPAKTAWQELRKAAEAESFGTFGIGPVETQAIQDNRSPAGIDRLWAIEVSERISKQSQRAKFYMALGRLDRMVEHTVLARLLYGQKIGGLPDLRKRGAVSLPYHMDRNLKECYTTLGFSKSYCREARSTVCKLLTVAAQQDQRIDTLEQALTQAEQLAPDVATLRKAKKVQRNLTRCSELKRTV
jgi:hypothetical protein